MSMCSVVGFTTNVLCCSIESPNGVSVTRAAVMLLALHRLAFIARVEFEARVKALVTLGQEPGLRFVKNDYLPSKTGEAILSLRLE